MREGAYPAARRLAICTPDEAASSKVVCSVVKPMPCKTVAVSEQFRATTRTSFTLIMIVEKLDTMLRRLRKCILLRRATTTHPFGIWAAMEATKSSHVLGSVSACLIYARHSSGDSYSISGAAYLVCLELCILYAVLRLGDPLDCLKLLVLPQELRGDRRIREEERKYNRVCHAVIQLLGSRT